MEINYKQQFNKTIKKLDGNTLHVLNIGSVFYYSII